MTGISSNTFGGKDNSADGLDTPWYSLAPGPEVAGGKVSPRREFIILTY